MTTKIKARKYRVRRNKSDETELADATTLPNGPENTDDGLGASTQPEPTEDVAAAIAASEETPAGGGTTIEEIKAEGLTGRQLRMARRVAQKQGLSPTSDYDAVKMLRERGVDPFKRSNMLELVISDKADKTEAKQILSALPAKLGADPKVPSTQTADPTDQAEQAQQIMAMQRDIVRRRRRRAALLTLRLLFFVVLPSAVAGYYYYNIATPMYATHSEFVIQQAEGGGSKAGGLLAGTSLANSQDSITVQGYLNSRDALLRLDADTDFKAHFSDPNIDVIQRLPEGATNEAAYKLFKKNVKIGFDPTEGVIKMDVIAADPQVSTLFSEKLIEYAEQQVDQLTARLRADQMDGADQTRKTADEKMIAAQQRIVEIQEKLGVLNPESEIAGIMAQIGTLEGELLTERLALRTTLDNTRPNQAKVTASENKIEEIEKLIAEKRSELTSSGSDTGSLARITGELMVAQADLETRQELLFQAEAQFEVARMEANRQVRYLSIGVSPVAPDAPSYPRAFENTILAFLIFSGIYLMVSLTASILREQV